MRLDMTPHPGRPFFSFEFFPPRSDAGEEALFQTIAQLRELEPTFVSVTYGAGGSTRTRTLELVARIRRETDIEPVAHMTCAGSTVDELRGLLDALIEAGIDNVLALRGDPTDGADTFTPVPGGLAHGHELIRLIRDHYNVSIGAACHPENHPETDSADAEVRHAKQKEEAGADFLVSNLFFDNAAFFDFVARARAAGVGIPIVPGIMPVTNVDQIRRFTTKMGAHIPDALLRQLDERKTDPDAVLQLGVAWATLQCAELLAAGAPGIHFYTLNRSPATRAILSALLAARPWATRR
ncbi:MAG: methylenetetrahydrofolate reductase [NAD(P)H] [Candidatus Dormibacteraeota bacterium]|nr:methylenetetrahydrofolate reductase [NAD(P)H] [Candidatus Dormibacteraeota bacterium]